MKCAHCDSKLLVSHSYGTPRGRVQRLECEGCCRVYTAAVLLVNEEPRRGEGAAALAKKVAQEGIGALWEASGKPAS